MTLRIAPALVAAVVSLHPAGAHAASITVITSFLKEITDAYKKAFEKKSKHQSRSLERECDGVSGIHQGDRS